MATPLSVPEYSAFPLSVDAQFTATGHPPWVRWRNKDLQVPVMVDRKVP